MIVEHIIIHCSATKASQNIGAAEIRRWHTDPPPKGNGWTDIGYHYVIRRDGDLDYGRNLATPGAHAKPWNHNSIGICMVGGIADDGAPEDNFTPEQWKSLEALVRRLTTAYRVSDVIGHRDVPGVTKACPSFDAKAWWAKVQQGGK